MSFGDEPWLGKGQFLCWFHWGSDASFLRLKYQRGVAIPDGLKRDEQMSGEKKGNEEVFFKFLKALCLCFEMYVSSCLSLFLSL